MRRKVYWLFVICLLSAAASGQESTKKQIEPGKFLLLKGHVVQEDTLIARSVEKERELGLILNKFTETLDFVDFLKKQDSLTTEQLNATKRILARKNYIIAQQDTLIMQLEKIAEPDSKFAAFFKRVFDRKVMFIIGFVAGIYAGVAL